MPLRQLYPEDSALPGNAKVDIIAVHGLNPYSKGIEAHAWDTWSKPGGKKGHVWLRDDLPQLLPEARIFLYEYDSTAVYGENRDSFIDKANSLLDAMMMKRDGVESRPLILLGHSLGGLLVKQALINAHNNEEYDSIKKATTGLAFFATPHRGGDNLLVTLGSVAENIASYLGFQKGGDLMQTLSSGSLFSDIMEEQFRHRQMDYNIVSFWGTLDNIVPKKSTRFMLGGKHEAIVTLIADHSGVCRFDGTSQVDKDNLELVEFKIKDLYKKALKHGELSALPSATGLREGVEDARDVDLAERFDKLREGGGNAKN
ncbi:hypothetical protein FQN49_005404 [Arthroderma sp. PD_2]|nr:hypothetical protein FQN49_005404 [Arthroderma sp. PD_2]